MNKQTAIEHVLNGAKVKRPHWKGYLTCVLGTIVYVDSGAANEILRPSFTEEDNNANDFITFK